ncbi:MAG: AbrB/MazE/SpoVT family DNA-binding domain-containing protein, partial [Lachnospiraceae bacterium]
MKSTGIVRKMDELGRITIPIEIRRHLKLETRDSLEIFIENDHI